MLLIKKKQKNKDLSTTLCGGRVYGSEIYLRVALAIIFLIKYFTSYPYSWFSYILQWTK